MFRYKPDPDCPICQREDVSAIDERLAVISNQAMPSGIAYKRLAGLLGLDYYELSKHERYHRDTRN